MKRIDYLSLADALAALDAEGFTFAGDSLWTTAKRRASLKMIGELALDDGRKLDTFATGRVLEVFDDGRLVFLFDGRRYVGRPLRALFFVESWDRWDA